MRQHLAPPCNRAVSQQQQQEREARQGPPPGCEGGRVGGLRSRRGWWGGGRQGGERRREGFGLGAAGGQLLGLGLPLLEQQALLAREALPMAARTPAYLYMDAFAVFTGAGAAGGDLVERARKYGMGVTLAHQVLADLPPKLLAVLLGNVGTVVALPLAAADAQKLARELPLADLDGKLQPTVLQNLPLGQAWVRTPPQARGVPVLVPATPDVRPHPDPTWPARLLAASKQQWGGGGRAGLDSVGLPAAHGGPTAARPLAHGRPDPRAGAAQPRRPASRRRRHQARQGARGWHRRSHGGEGLMVGQTATPDFLAANV